MRRRRRTSFTLASRIYIQSTTVSCILTGFAKLHSHVKDSQFYAQKLRTQPLPLLSMLFWMTTSRAEGTAVISIASSSIQWSIAEEWASRRTRRRVRYELSANPPWSFTSAQPRALRYAAWKLTPPLNILSVWGRQDMGGGEDTLVGRADVIPDGDGPIYVSFGVVVEKLARWRLRLHFRNHGAA